GVATWCTACVAEIPELRVLRATLGPDELAMIGVPFDPNETPSKLRRWVERHNPPYEMAELTEAELEGFTAVVKSELRQTGRLPLSVVTDADGHVLLARWGIPTLSELRSLQWRSAGR
ncbi:MAG: redoxin domain-containing protein, partial [Planctomycetota bacterium]